jgi:uncharacterized membrane protein YheB (UPF0754 family)
MFLTNNFKSIKSQYRISYLTEANRNKINRILSESCRKLRNLQEIDSNLEGSSVDYSEYIEREDQKAIMRHFLKKFPARVKNIMELKLVGYKTEDIAIKLRMKVTDVNRIYNRFVKRFQYIHGN